MDMKINVRRLKALRNKKLWSQEELATACGLSLRTIQRLEGEGQASPETIKSLAAVFEINHDHLQQLDSEPPDYLNVQLGFVLILIFVGVACFLAWGLQSGSISSSVFLISLILCASVGGAFSTLTTRVSNEKIEWSFAFGFLRRSIPIQQIKSAKIVRNKWWWGLGIRLTPNGWLYCVSGLDAIALRLKDGHKVLIGTDEPDEFMDAIDQVIIYK